MSDTASTQPALPIRGFAEFLGTAILVIGGVGTAVAAPSTGTAGIALAFGLTLLVLAYALGPVSGCHVNPAVTLGLLVARRINAGAAAIYVLAQTLGGIAGAAVVLAIRNGSPTFSLKTDGLGTNGWGAGSAGGYGMSSAIVVELVLTALLVLVVLAATTRQSNAAVAGLPIGFALVVCHLVAIPVDGTSVNPARSLGPALITGGTPLHQVWLFILVPLVGGIVGALVFRALNGSSEELVALRTPDPTTRAGSDD